MTIDQAVSYLDRLCANACPREDKVLWLVQLEENLKRHVLDTHEGGLEAGTLTAGSPGTSRLLAPEPFDRMYTAWLEAMLHLYHGELERYNAAIDIFHREFAAFESWYNRKFPPKHGGTWRG